MVKLSDLDVTSVRRQFPALARTADGRSVVYADAPGGTQTPERVIEAMAAYLRGHNANTGGTFATSRETEEIIAEGRSAAADLLGGSADECVFGQNMTTRAFGLSRSVAVTLSPGDEVVVTQLDHDANIAPWLAVGAETGATVRWADLREDDCALDMHSLSSVLSLRTRVVAFTLASNAVGSVIAADEVVGLVRERSPRAIMVADAVHFAPHRLIDVRALGVDVLFCSSYKFFGPHLGIMWGRKPLLESLPAYKVRPQYDRSPERWETGTLSHEAIAGFVATVEYVAGLGRGAESATVSDRRGALMRGMDAIQEHERVLIRRFLRRLADVPGIRLWGIADPSRAYERTPTFAIRLQGCSPRATTEALGHRGIFAWDGNYFALAVMERLGLEATGGAVRIGFCHYNTIQEVDRVVDELAALSRGGAGTTG